MDKNTPRRRMTGTQRKAQLVDVGRRVFAAKGLEAASMEEIAAAAGVSKPVVYEHFGNKENLYAAVVKHEMAVLDSAIRSALSLGRSRARIENAVLALLTYVEENQEGFAIVSRDPGISGGFETLLNNATESVTPILADALDRAGFNKAYAVIYANSLVGMVAQTSRWWLEKRSPAKEIVAAHIVNLCWNGLAGMEKDPILSQIHSSTLPEEGAHFGAGVDADPARTRGKNDERP